MLNKWRAQTGVMLLLSNYCS